MGIPETGVPIISADLTGLTLDAARALLEGVEIEVTETVPPLGAKSPLRGATDDGALRVLRARKDGERWLLLVAREQTRA